MGNKRLTVVLAALALIISAGTGVVAMAHAQDSANADSAGSSATDQRTREKPAAMGSVTAVSGNTITLTDTQSKTTYTVDAANATIEKREAPAKESSGTQGKSPAPTTISVSDVKVGDLIMVQGTVNGTTITATKIEDGMFFGGMHGMGRGPGVRGTVSAIDGSTLTVTDKNGKTYSVNASSAKASKTESIDVSDIKVGDSVGIEGQVNGNSVTAKMIMDGAPAP